MRNLESPAAQASRAELRSIASTEGLPATLHRLSKKEQQKKWQEFCEQFDHVGPDERVAMMEGFLGNGSVGETEMLPWIKRLSAEEHVELTFYLVDVLKPDAFVRVFYACWPSLPYEMQRELIQHFSLDEPQYAILVAPFANIARIPEEVDRRAYDTRMKERMYLRKKHIPEWTQIGSFFEHAYATKRGREKEDELIALQKKQRPELVAAVERHYNHFEAAKRLFEICLEENPASCRPLFEYYCKRQPAFVFPYMPRLIQERVCTKDDWKEVLWVLTDRHQGDEFFATQEERERGRILLARLKKEDPEQADYAHQIISDLKSLRAKKIALERQRLLDERKKRCVDHMFGDVPSLHGLIQDKEWEPLLFKLLERTVPVFYVLPRVPLSQQQANIFLNRAIDQGEFASDLSELEDFHGIIRACGETRAAALLMKSIKDYYVGSDRFVDRVFAQLPKVLSWFSEKYQEQIIQTISQYNPQLWLKQFDYALEHRTISLPKFMTKAQTDPEQFLGQFDRILRYARVTEPDPQRAAVLFDRLRETARNSVYQHPIYFFRYPALMATLLSATEREQFVTQQLETAKPDARFLHRLLDAATPQATRDLYQDQISTAMVWDEDVFCELLESPRYSDVMIGMLGDRAFERKFFSVLGRVNHEDVTSSAGGGLSHWLYSNPRRVQRFLLALEPHDEDLSQLAYFMDHASGVAKRLKLSVQDQKKDAKKNKTKTPFVDTNTYDQSVLLLQEELKRRLSLQPELCFTEAVWNIQDLPDPYIPWEQVDTLIEERPESFDWLQKRLNDKDKHRYVQKYARALAFGSRKGQCIFDEKKLLATDAQMLYDLNPALYNKEQRSEEDYYQAVIAKFADRPFFSLYEKRLQMLAEAEMERCGVQKASEVWDVQPEFAALVRRVGLLAACPLAVRHEGWIMTLPEPEQAVILQAFEMLSLFEIEADIDEARLRDKDAATYLANVIQAHLFRVLKLPPTTETQGATVQMRPEAIQAFILYFRGVCQKTKGMVTLLQEVFRQVSAGTYEDWRAWGETDPKTVRGREEAMERLKAQRLLPEKLTLDTYVAWNASENLDMDAVLDVSMSDVTDGIRSVLGQAVADRHLPEDTFKQSVSEVAEAYEQLYLPMQLWNDRITELRGILGGGKKRQEGRPEQEELDQLMEEARTYREERQGELDRLKALTYIHRFRVLTARELEEKTLLIEKTKVPFAQAFKMIEKAFADAPDFQQDIQRMKMQLQDVSVKMFGGARVSRSHLRITDAVNAEVAIRIGEIPVPSCQHYAPSHTRGLNQGLLAYVSDPAVKIIQLYDDKGQLITRAILRLLQDDEGKPQLFLERVYSTNNHHKIREAVVQFARKKAKRMGVGLYSHASETDNVGLEASEVQSLHSRGSRNTHVYTDAGGGLITKGVFSIKSAYQIG